MKQHEDLLAQEDTQHTAAVERARMDLEAKATALEMEMNRQNEETLALVARARGSSRASSRAPSSRTTSRAPSLAPAPVEVPEVPEETKSEAMTTAPIEVPEQTIVDEVITLYNVYMCMFDPKPLFFARLHQLLQSRQLRRWRRWMQVWRRRASHYPRKKRRLNPTIRVRATVVRSTKSAMRLLGADPILHLQAQLPAL